MHKKTKVLNIRIDADLKRTAKKIAVEDGRSLSNWVIRLMDKEVKKAEQKLTTVNNGFISLDTTN